MQVSVLPLVERRVGYWCESRAQSGTLPILLTTFVLFWLVFQIVSYAAIDLHPDPLEVFAWSRHPSAGYFKHPPLGAWMAAAWFAVFPTTDWSFQLLSNVNAAVALWSIYLIARRHVDGDKALFVLLLLMLTPFYQFHAQRFGSNQTLLSLWPIATYCFLRAFESRETAWSAAAGLTSAIAMLGKYFSVFLVAGFVVAALTHPRRWDYLRSSSPWISIVAGLTLLMPHAYWLATTGYQPFDYALHAHQAATLFAAMLAAATYAVGGIGYMLLPTGIYLLLVRPNRATLVDALWPRDPDRRVLATILWTSLGLPMVTAPILRSELTPLWTMQGWFLLPILLIAPGAVVLTRLAAVRAAIAVLFVSLAVLFSAPALAWVKHFQGTHEGRAYFRSVAGEVTRLWSETTGTRLTIVDGDPVLAVAATFYSPDRPDYVPYFNLSHAPWITEKRLDREGSAIVCPSTDGACAKAGRARAVSRTDARITEVEIVPRFLGAVGQPKRFLIIIVPPRWSTLSES
jgi:4-amino-4-deoxy-L-arabinose transferase-like glycosyltransferase